MAMARKPRDPTGKMGGLAVGSECDLCGATKSIKYCAECNVKLCPTCTKGHGVLPATRDHQLLDVAMLSSGSSYAKSGDAESGPSRCTKHYQEVQEFYCEECKLIICRDCRKDHKGHSINELKDDIQMYQAICTEHIKSLLDKSHDLEGSKILIGGIFKSYTEAIEMVKKWENELIKLVEECSRLLMEDLGKTKNEWENILDNKMNGLNATVDDVESGISKLQSIRKVSDVDLFSQELAASQQLLERINHFIENILPALTVPKMDELLPNKSKLPSVKSGITSFMSRSKGNEAACKDSVSIMTTNTRDNSLRKSTATVNNLLARLCADSQQMLDSKFDIPDPNCGTSGYRVGETDGDNVLLYGSQRKDIRVLNVTNGSFDRFTSYCEIWDIISIGLGEYIGVRMNKLYLLNSKFEIEETKDTTAKCNGVAYLSEHRFALLEVDKLPNKWIGNISVINIEDGRFLVESSRSVEVPEVMKYMVADTSKNHVYMFGNNHLYKFNLIDGSLKHKDMSQWNIKIWSLCVVDENILLGDGGGQVHLLHENLDYRKVIIKIPTGVRGIALANDYLVLVSRENTVFLYK